MKRILLGLVLLFAWCLLFQMPAIAGSTLAGNGIRYFGSGTNDTDTLFTTGDMSQYDACVIMSTTGAVNVFVSLDGTNFSTAPLSLQDFGSTDVLPVLLTASNRVYALVGKYLAIRVKQTGSTAAAASMTCWKR